MTRPSLRPAVLALALATSLATPATARSASLITTSQIADGAITTPKLAAGAVTAPKLGTSAVGTPAIADSAVTAAKLGAGAVTAPKLAGGAVGTSAIADGAVTAPKLAGPIPASLVEAGAFQRRPAQVVVVAKAGGDFSDLAAALASITDASAAKPYLVKVMPGVYDTSAGPAVLKSHVHVEGSGRSASRLTHAAIADVDTAVMTGSGLVDVEIRDLGIEFDAGSYFTNVGVFPGDFGIRVDGSVLKLSRVALRIAGAPAHKNVYGIHLASSTVAMDDVAVDVQNPGVDSAQIQGVTLSDCRATLNGVGVTLFSGTYAYSGLRSLALVVVGGGEVSVSGARLDAQHWAAYVESGSTARLQITGSTLRSDLYGVDHRGGGGAVIAASRIEAPTPVSAAHTYACFDGAFNPLPNQ